MKKYVYTEEQMLKIVSFLNGLTMAGIEACRTLTEVADIIDHPVNEIEEEEGEKDEPKCIEKNNP